MELASYYVSGAYNFEAEAKFLERALTSTLGMGRSEEMTIHILLKYPEMVESKYKTAGYWSIDEEMAFKEIVGRINTTETRNDRKILA